MYKAMDDKEHASFLTSLATRLRDSVGDHLKLLRIADELEAQALGIIDPKSVPPVLTGKAAEDEANRLAMIARGHDPALVAIEPVVPPVPEPYVSTNPEKPAAVSDDEFYLPGAQTPKEAKVATVTEVTMTKAKK